MAIIQVLVTAVEIGKIVYENRRMLIKFGKEVQTVSQRKQNQNKHRRR